VTIFIIVDEKKHFILMNNALVVCTSTVTNIITVQNFEAIGTNLIFALCHMCVVCVHCLYENGSI
jgi:hypothetical protein